MIPATCNISDVEADIRIQNLSVARAISWRDHYAGIPRNWLSAIKLGLIFCAVIPASSSRLTLTLCVGDLPEIVLHGKQHWVARVAPEPESCDRGTSGRLNLPHDALDYVSCRPSLRLSIGVSTGRITSSLELGRAHCKSSSMPVSFL